MRTGTAPLPALLFLTFLTAFGPGSPPHEETPVLPDRPDLEIQQLRRELDGILRSTGNRSGRWGVLAFSLDHRDTLLALNPREPLVPASNMKLLTTAAALHYLGPDFRYQTFLLTHGVREEEALEGDLVLYGTGDPTLSERYLRSEYAFMDSLAAKVVEAGIREIRGDLVVDGSFFQGPELHPEWDPRDFNDAFSAPISALSLNENILTLRVEPGAWVGAQPSIHTIPIDTRLRHRNLARTTPAGTGSRIWLLRENPTDPIGIEGEISLGSPDVWRRLPVPDPLRYAGNQLLRGLEDRGVRVRGRVVPVRDPAVSRLSANPASGTRDGEPRPQVLAVRNSPPLIEILRVVNKESNNFFAESVAKTLGRMVLGDGSFSGGQRAVERFLVSEVGIRAEEFRIRDGSGLSKENLASPGVFIQVLDFMSSSDLWEDYWSTLPEAGVRRELGRMYRSPAAGNLRAKTGTLDRVSALSGMVTTRSGERIVFSILSNEVASEYRAKRAEDQIGIRLASLTRPIQN